MNSKNSSPPLIISTTASLEAKLVSWEWPWVKENKSAIEENWNKRKQHNQSIFNGRVLLARNAVFTPQASSLQLFEVNYSEMVAALDLNVPDYDIWNAFAMGALRGSDGAYICGIMGEDTFNAGRVYFPAGTPDREDCRTDGTVDLAGSLLRELEEETGLSEGFQVETQWLAVQSWPALALISTVNFDEPAHKIAARIEKNLQTQDKPELAGTRIIQNQKDIDPTVMPQYLQHFFSFSFGLV